MRKSLPTSFARALVPLSWPLLLGLAAGFILTAPSAAQAQNLGKQLEKGPLLGIEIDDNGRFKRGVTYMDVNASSEVVWATLTDFERYPKFMPRMEEVEVDRKKDYIDVECELDTPLVDTEYTMRIWVDNDKKQIRTKTIAGDNKGSAFFWSVRSIDGGKRTRVTYKGAVENLSSVVHAIDDETQTVTIGVNTALLLAGVKSIAREAEARQRRAAAAAKPSGGSTLGGGSQKALPRN